MAVDPLPLDFGSDKPFYVYLYRDPRPGKRKQPIYVGKGKVRARRAEGDHTHNPFLIKILAKIGLASLEPIIEVVGWFDDEAEAFALEKALIGRFGRRDLRRGPLTNLTGGGQGSTAVSEQTREKLARASASRWKDPEYAERIRSAGVARWLDPEWRSRRVQQIRALAQSPDHRAKLSAAQAAVSIEVKQARAKRLRDPDVRERAKEGTRAYLRSERYHEYKSAAHKEWWSDPDNRSRNMDAIMAAHRRPEEKERKRAASRKAFDGKRDQILAGSKAAWSDPENRSGRLAKIGAANKAHYENNPEKRRLRAAEQKARWADPAYREMRRQNRAAKEAQKNGEDVTADVRAADERGPGTE